MTFRLPADFAGMSCSRFLVLSLSSSATPTTVTMESAALNGDKQMYSVWYQILLEKLLRLTAARGDLMLNPFSAHIRTCAKELPAHLLPHHIQDWNRQRLDKVFEQLISLAKEVLFRRYDASVQTYDTSAEYDKWVNSLVRNELQLCREHKTLTMTRWACSSGRSFKSVFSITW